MSKYHENSAEIYFSLGEDATRLVIIGIILKPWVARKKSVSQNNQPQNYYFDFIPCSFLAVALSRSET